MKHVPVNKAFHTIVVLIALLFLTGFSRPLSKANRFQNLQLLTSVPSQGVCKIVGKISGQLKWPVVTEPGATPTMHVVKTVVLVSSNGQAREALIDQHENYQFNDVPINQTYRIYLVGCRSDPKVQKLTPRRANARYHKNFKIIGGPTID